LVKKAPVSIGWQVVFQFVPFLGWWCFYRIQKFRRMLLLILFDNALFFGYIFFIIGIDYTLDFFTGGFFDNSIFMITFFGIFIFTKWIWFYFLIKWSREWNEYCYSQ